MRRDRILRALVRRRFLITMVDGQTWDGVVMETDDYSVVLRDAHALTEKGPKVEKVRADGEVVLPRARVAYMQRPIGDGSD